MERSRTVPAGGIRPPDLVELAERSGPFASVWLGLSGQGSYAEQQDSARIDEIGRELGRAGAPEEARAAVVEALTGAEPDVTGIVVVAEASGLVLVERLAEPPRQDVARWEPLPSISAVLEHRQADIPLIVALADRLGADIMVRARHGHDVVVDVEGADHPIHRSAPGGWSQRRFQQRAENTWERNAADVVQHVVQLASKVNPVLLLVGGDVRAVDYIIDDLPDALRPIVRTVAGGRAMNGSEQHHDRDVDRLVRTAVADATVELLQEFDEEVGRSGQAANGPAATMACLQRSQVDVLIVHDDPSDDRISWFTTTPGMVAPSRDGLVDIGDAEPAAGRLVDVAINAALRTGAAVRVVPDAAALDGGIGALLRWETS